MTPPHLFLTATKAQRRASLAFVKTTADQKERENLSMKKLLIYICAVLMLSACSDKAGVNGEKPDNPRAQATPLPSPNSPQAGDTVIYHSDTGQRFYEVKIKSIEGTRARLQDGDKTVERELADLYAMPKAGQKVTAQPGDIVAARYGQTLVWPGAEVLKVGDKVTLKWLSNGKTEEVSHENVLALPAAVAAKVKASFPASR
jgi:hypothetical protein